jgi:hypothetical protein
MNEELKTFKITKQDLAKLLSVAFEKGRRGYLDLKEAIVDEIVDKFAEEHKTVERPPLPSTWTVPGAVWHMYSPNNQPVIDYGPNGPNWFIADRGV